MPRMIDPARLPEHRAAPAAEARWEAEWARRGVYAYDPACPREETFVVDTPPPTVSAPHVGTCSATPTPSTRTAGTWRRSPSATCSRRGTSRASRRPPCGDVDFQTAVAQAQGKGSPDARFPFSALPALAALLVAQRERTAAMARATGRVIPHVFHREGIPIRSYRGAWARACAATGLKGRLVHDFRRTAVRNLERAGVPRSVAMQLTGHRTESIYRRYAIVSEADLAAGVARLAVLHDSLAKASPTVVPMEEARQARTATVQPQSGGETGSADTRPPTPSPRSDEMPRRGVEPLHPCGRRILSPLRLPVPPPRRPPERSRFVRRPPARGRLAHPRGNPSSWRSRIGFDGDDAEV